MPGSDLCGECALQVAHEQRLDPERHTAPVQLEAGDEPRTVADTLRGTASLCAVVGGISTIACVLGSFAHDEPLILIGAGACAASGAASWALFTAAAEALELLRDIRESLRR